MANAREIFRLRRSMHVTPAQELEDFRRVLAALETHYTSNLGVPLTADACNGRFINETIHQLATHGEQALHNDSWMHEFSLRTNDVLQQHAMLLWPLCDSKVPTPTSLLSDEVAAAVRHMQPAKSEVAALWLSLQAQLHKLLMHISLTPPSHISSFHVQREADKARVGANVDLNRLALPCTQEEARRAALARRPVGAQATYRLRTLSWRDVIAPALASCDTTLVAAAQRTLNQLEALYGAYPYELHLRRRTWSIEQNPNIDRRALLLRHARNQVPSYDVTGCIWQASRRALLQRKDDRSTSSTQCNLSREGCVPEEQVGYDVIRDALLWNSDEDLSGDELDYSSSYESDDEESDMSSLLNKSNESEFSSFQSTSPASPSLSVQSPFVQ